MAENNYNIHLTKCPIVETSLDIICSFHIPSEAVIGVIYNLLLQKKIGVVKLDRLPITNIPEEIRKNDPNLKNKPTHQIVCNDGIVLIGSNVLSFGILPPYKSWNVVQSFIKKVIKIIATGSIIKGISQVNLRYLNFFELNIFENIKLSINFQGSNITYPSTIFRAEIPSKSNEYINALQITSNIHLKNPGLKLDADGSLIDITVVSKKASLANIEDIIEAAHTEAKVLFFDLLKDDFTKSLI